MPNSELQPTVVQGTEIYQNIQESLARHGKRMNYQINHTEMIRILKHQKYSANLESMISQKLTEAEQRVDKRGIDKQRQIRDKFQPTHGVIIKNIPDYVERQVVYDGILALGQLRNQDGSFKFESELRMRSFQYPNLKGKYQERRIAFPIFVSESDRNELLRMAEDNADHQVKLSVSDNEERNFKSKDWSGVCTIEPVKPFTGENFSDTESEKENRRYFISSDGYNSRMSEVSVGNSSNRLFHTPNPCVSPNPVPSPGPLSINTNHSCVQNFNTDLSQSSPISNMSYTSLPNSGLSSPSIQTPFQQRNFIPPPPGFLPPSPQQQQLFQQQIPQINQMFNNKQNVSIAPQINQQSMMVPQLNQRLLTAATMVRGSVYPSNASTTVPITLPNGVEFIQQYGAYVNQPPKVPKTVPYIPKTVPGEATQNDDKLPMSGSVKSDNVE